MGLNSGKPYSINCHFYKSRPNLPFWVTANKLPRETMDDSNQPLCPWRYRAPDSQHDYPFLFWKILVHAGGKNKFPHRLLCRRDTGEHLLSDSGAAFFHSCWRLRGRFCSGRSTGSNEAQVKSICLPHTSPTPSMGSGDWGFLSTLTFPTNSLAGSPWRSGIWSSRRLLLQEKRTPFLLVRPSLSHNRSTQPMNTTT